MAKVDETEKGWFLAWIDSSPKALEKAVRLLLSLFFNSFFLSLYFFLLWLGVLFLDGMGMV